ncbi:co-chaperone YbbN [uncultured Kordia sp.]|uniref:thioredoxin family protein n=1 Tax=uncultured Kordia sp. TaxID=507699 RepID=UPI00260D3488|nr:thioredoxin family protein [uncultured Kordia sp.]
MKNVTIIFCVIAGLLLLPTEIKAQEVTQPKLVIVKFHADWCGSCKAMGTALEDLTNKFDGEAALFVELDFTNNTKKHQSLLLASAMGIDNIVANNNATGFFLVIDSKTKEIKAKLTKKQTTKEMAQQISSFL